MIIYHYIKKIYPKKARIHDYYYYYFIIELQYSYELKC